MRLHCDVRVQVVERAIRLFAAVPTALVHALDFFVASSRSLVLLRAWNRDKRVNRRQRVTALRVEDALVYVFSLSHKRGRTNGETMT